MNFCTNCCKNVKRHINLETARPNAMSFLEGKKVPSLPVICASVCHARSNPGWNVSGRGVLRPRKTEQQVKLNSLRICPASQLLQ